MPSPDRAALLALSLLLPTLPACVSTQPAEIGRRDAGGPIMPAIQVARTNQSAEPPLAEVVLTTRPDEDSVILPARAESPVGAADRVRPAVAEEGADEPGPWAKPDPKPHDPPLLAAMRYYLNDSPEQAARSLEGMDEADRTLLAALLPLAVRVGGGALRAADPQDIAGLVSDLQGLVAPLRERAALEVPKLCFCRPKAAPAQFGKYDPLGENHPFRPGDLIGLYVEVRNFTSVPNGEICRTHVRMAIEVMNDRGETVLRFDPPSRTDPSLSPRQDYCNVGLISLPPNMPAGAYTLWLKVTDVPTGRTARRALDFRVTTVSGREGEKER
jgi:hypothetical protein